MTRLLAALVFDDDPDRALAFYVGTLGLEKRRDVPFGQGQRWVEVAPAGAPTTIALSSLVSLPVGILAISLTGMREIS